MLRKIGLIERKPGTVSVFFQSTYLMEFFTNVASPVVYLISFNALISEKRPIKVISLMGLASSERISFHHRSLEKIVIRY